MDEKISDGGETFMKEEKLTYRDIVLKQFQRVVNNFSKEMVPGYDIKNYPMGGSGPAVLTKYVGDSRKELMQSIDVLHDMLQPKFDKGMKEKSKQLLLVIIKRKKANEYKPLLMVYRKMFQYICLFLERQSWFVTEATED